MKGMKKPKTPKEKAFFKNLTDGMSLRQAAIKAGYSEKSAHTSAKVNVEKCQDYWTALCDKHGAKDEDIIIALGESLKATKVIGYLQNINKDKDGQMHKILPDECVSNEFVEVPDYPTRIKAADVLLKLKNAYPKDKTPFGDGVSKIEVTYG